MLQPHLVQYQGSKRALAPQILPFLPERFNRLVEPFCGMAAVSIAVAKEGRAESYLLNDANGPLISMLSAVIDAPDALSDAYEALWVGQMAVEDHTEHFYKVREDFNSGNKAPEVFLYLLARCVKGSLRYSSDGNMNQSPDKRRHGTKPETIRKNAVAISRLLRGKTALSALDYKEVLRNASEGDIVYMDPPYQGVSDSRDKRYIGGVEFEDFCEALQDLTDRQIPFIVSYDGMCGWKSYGRDLPEDALDCRRFWLKAGRSTQATLLGRDDITTESLYVSNSLLRGKDVERVS